MALCPRFQEFIDPFSIFKRTPGNVTWVNFNPLSENLNSQKLPVLALQKKSFKSCL